MPFLLYDVSGHSYRCVRAIQLAGTSGPLAKIQHIQNKSRKTPFPWHATADDIVGELPDGKAGQAIIIDLKPRAAHNVSLYQLLDVWGFSYKEWTPLALLLECLFADVRKPDPRKFKESFRVIEAKRERVGEFLYLQGGVCGGTWNWGMIGRVNGTLLWPEAFSYLAGELGRALRT